VALDLQRLERLRSEGGFFPIGDRRLIRVSGADALRYLNGQVSNDLRRQKPGVAQQALVLTAKGKLCAPLWIWPDGDAFLVEPPAEVAEDVLPRLERYAISDDVVFDLVESAPPAWHVFGPAVAKVDAGLLMDRLGIPGADVSQKPDGLLEASADEVTAIRIQNGIPQWGSELDGDILPQEARLERFAVDFHKGCYVGQETVSRLKSIGRVNELLYGFRGVLAPNAGHSALSLANSQGKTVGRLTSHVEIASSGSIAALGFLSTREAETHFDAIDESGACFGRVERCEFPLILA
jgi:tRNA-modifying protein YgfZ